jgi:hypothetical protein
MNEFKELLNRYSPKKVDGHMKNFLQQEMEQFADYASYALVITN